MRFKFGYKKLPKIFFFVKLLKIRFRIIEYEMQYFNNEKNPLSKQLTFTTFRIENFIQEQTKSTPLLWKIVPLQNQQKFNSGH